MDTKMRTFGYLPIISVKDLPELTDFPVRHLKRQMEAVTEVIAKLAQIQNQEIRAILTEYEAVLIEAEDGSKTIGLSFPEKRFH